MGIISKLRAFFADASGGSMPARAVAVELSASNDETEAISDTDPQKTETLQAAMPIPGWLRDEESLRDEAVVFGLTTISMDDKVAIIHNYFASQTSYTAQSLAQTREKISEFDQLIGHKKDQIYELEKLYITVENNGATPTQIPRVVVGFGLSIAMCVSNFYLIEQSLRPIYGDNRLVAVGVFLAGMFSLFGRMSVFHDTDSNLNWRKLLEEIGMPAAAATFILVQAAQNQPIERALALFFFTFFLFLLSGKLLLSNLSALTTEVATLLKKATDRRQKKVRCREIADLQAQIDALKAEKGHLVPAANRDEAELTRQNARRDMLVKLFESEFKLARTVREQLSERQLGQLLNQNYADGQ